MEEMVFAAQVYAIRWYSACERKPLMPRTCEHASASPDQHCRVPADSMLHGNIVDHNTQVHKAAVLHSNVRFATLCWPGSTTHRSLCYCTIASIHIMDPASKP